MSALAPKWNDWALSNAGVTITSVEVDPQYGGKGERSVAADGGVVSEGLLGTMTIRLGGTIAAATNQVARDYYSTLLANLRGSDRVKKGRLDLYGDSHYFCQLTGVTPLRHLTGEGNVSISLTFESDEPYHRLNAVTTFSEVISATDPSITIAYGTTLLGNAPRVPLVLKAPTMTFAAGDVVRITNSTAGWTFAHVVTQALTSSDLLVIDGETCEVLEKGVPVGEGNAGVFPYLVGGATNAMTLAGTTTARLTGTWSVEFWDRSLG